jgi:hypothetical protein
MSPRPPWCGSQPIDQSACKNREARDTYALTSHFDPVTFSVATGLESDGRRTS